MNGMPPCPRIYSARVMPSRRPSPKKGHVTETASPLPHSPSLGPTSQARPTVSCRWRVAEHYLSTSIKTLSRKPQYWSNSSQASKHLINATESSQRRTTTKKGLSTQQEAHRKSRRCHRRSASMAAGRICARNAGDRRYASMTAAGARARSAWGRAYAPTSA